MSDADVIIAGAGPAGLMTALTLAEHRRRVIVVEKKARELLGKPIRVTLEARVFPEVGLALPEPPELINPPMLREFISPDRNYKLKIRDLPLVTVDLHEFVRRLLEMAEARGVEFLFGANVTDPIIEDGKVIGMEVVTADDKPLKLAAPLTVDASGVRGVLRTGLDAAMGVETQIDPRDVCNAWHESREIDRETVRDLLSMNRIRPQVNVIRFGFMGAYSMFGVFVDLDDDRVDITVGLPHDSMYPPARDLLHAYVESHQWIGELISGGGGLIPVRRPLDSFVANGFACAGDAACQAMAQHASGVGSALIAGRILGETAAGALESGDVSREALWLYNERYMESRGSIQANSDLFRRFLVTLSTDEMSLLFGKGLVTEEGIRGSLECLALELPKSAVFFSAPGLIHRPSLLYRLMRLAGDSLRVLDIYNSYPGADEAELLPQWRAEALKVFNRWKPRDRGARKARE